MLAGSYQRLSSRLLRATMDSLQVGNLRSQDFRVRWARYPEAARNARIFFEQPTHSAYGLCSDCPFRGECSVCPVSIAWDPSNTDRHRVPDFICAYNRVALRYRRLFPPAPDPLDELNSVLKRLAAGRSKPGNGVGPAGL
jgi:hypothetical protein